MNQPRVFERLWHGLVMPMCARLNDPLSDGLCILASRFDREFRQEVYLALSHAVPKAFPQLSPGSPALKNFVDNYLDMLARECCDIYCLAREGAAYLQRTARLATEEDQQTMQWLKNRSKPVIVVCFHFDRLTLAGSLMGFLGRPLSFVTQPIDLGNPEINPFMRRFLQMKVNVQLTWTQHWFVAGRDTKAMVRYLRNGGGVVVLPDVRLNNQQDALKYDFFGHELLLADGPLRLARLTEADIVYAAVKSDGRRCRVSLKRLDPSPDVAMQQCAQAFIEDVREAPWRWWQWNVFDYMITRPQ